MHPDEQAQYYNAGVKAGIEHSTMSLETKEMFKTMEEKIEKIEQKVENIALEIAKLPEKIVEKSDARYASKETEDTVKNLQSWIIRSGVTIIIIMGGIIAILITAYVNNIK